MVVSPHLDWIVAQLDRSVNGFQDAGVALPPGQDLKARRLQGVQADVQGGEAWGGGVTRGETVSAAHDFELR